MHLMKPEAPLPFAIAAIMGFIALGTQGGQKDLDFSKTRGRIQFAESFPDYPVKAVQNSPDLRVQIVEDSPIRRENGSWWTLFRITRSNWSIRFGISQLTTPALCQVHRSSNHSLVSKDFNGIEPGTNHAGNKRCGRAKDEGTYAIQQRALQRVSSQK